VGQAVEALHRQAVGSGVDLLVLTGGAGRYRVGEKHMIEERR
jgi:hypothetical protein